MESIVPQPTPLLQTNLNIPSQHRYQIMAMVRHCERADDPSLPHELKKAQGNNLIIEYDPQLSRPNGKQQAILTSQFLRTKLETQLIVDGGGIDFSNCEVQIYCSPFLSCLETASALTKTLGSKYVTVQDQLADSMMKNWYPEDPFIGIVTKLTSNKERFTEFLKSQYGLTDLVIEYKRSTNACQYPETVDQSNKRFRTFYKTIAEKQFPEQTASTNATQSKLVVFVTHGIPAHSPFLHMFEPDKDIVYLDYGAVTIVEKTGKSVQPLASDSITKKEEGNQERKEKKQDSIGDYSTQVGAWEIKQFADASHIPGLGVAML